MRAPQDKGKKLFPGGDGSVHLSTDPEQGVL